MPTPRDAGPEPPTARAPTVVVARRARPGADEALARWLEGIVEAARQAPGFVGAQVQPPDDAHPGEWLVVYRFATPEALEAWLVSERRAALLDGAAELVEGPAREQVVAVPAAPEPVTAVSSVLVAPEHVEAYAARHGRIVRALERTPGFRRAELLPPVPGVQEETITVLVFDDRGSLQAWLDSDLRRDLLAPLDALADGARQVNVVGGWAGWFAPDAGDPGPRRWKQAVVVLLALVPTSLAISAARAALLPDLGLVPSVVLGNVIGVAVLTWLLMPPLTRLLAGWLRR